MSRSAIRIYRYVHFYRYNFESTLTFASPPTNPPLTRVTRRLATQGIVDKESGPHSPKRCDPPQSLAVGISHDCNPKELLRSGWRHTTARRSRYTPSASSVFSWTPIPIMRHASGRHADDPQCSDYNMPIWNDPYGQPQTSPASASHRPQLVHRSHTLQG